MGAVTAACCRDLQFTGKEPRSGKDIARCLLKIACTVQQKTGLYGTAGSMPAQRI